MKQAFFFSLLLILGLLGVNSPTAVAQTTKSPLDAFEKPYHPEADARKDIENLLQQAGKENKPIIIQAGGNWCIWCLRFNAFIHQTPSIAKVLKDKLLYYHLNYSKENKNEAIFNKYAPEAGKLGYPFFIVMDKTGKVLLVRESGSLESGKGYDENKVLAFFNQFAG